MQLSPLYGPNQLIRIVTDLDPVTVMLSQRSRLERELAQLSDEQWSHPSRCAAWSIQDVITHLNSTNAFWAYSLRSGLAGKPTELLRSFDPTATPAQIVASAQAVGPHATLEEFVATNAALRELADDVRERQWDTLAEAPPGHVALGAVVLHALWDSLIHERDILIPLGIATKDEPVETIAALTYAVALSPAFAVRYGLGRPARVTYRLSNPSLAIEVAVSETDVIASTVSVEQPSSSNVDLVIAGSALEIREGLSQRGPLPEVATGDHGWVVNGLAAAFATS